jgi:hypothetical protein
MKQKRGSYTGDSSRWFAIKDSKGQITVFIIIGILLLFAFSGFLYITKKISTEEVTTEGEPVIASVPLAFKPLQVYTENCITQIGERGLLVLGQQGGYIYPDLVGKYSSTDPVEADGIDLEPIKVPYWHYNKNRNNLKTIKFDSLKPELYAKDDPSLSIESQLSRYTQENLAECLNDYEGFDQQGFLITASDEKGVLVTVGDNSVNFLLDMSLKAQKGGADVSMDKFFIKVPIRLKHYYDIASELTEAELKQSFLENVALELLQIYAHPDVTKLPPTTAVTFEDVSVNTWTVSDIRDKFKSLLISNIPLIRYQTSKNFFRFTYAQSALSPLYQKTYDNTIIPLTQAEDIEVSFDYFGWDPFVDVNEGQKEIAPLDFFISSPLPVVPFSFGFQKYYNTYDIAFPTLVSIYDSEALDGVGYLFTLALEGNVVNNNAARDNKTEPEVIVDLKGTMVCDSNKKNTEMIRAVIVDSFTQEPLEMVKIGYTIPDQDTCSIGVTSDDGSIDSKYPGVYGGTLSMIKPGYLTTYYPFDTYEYISEPGITGYAVEGVGDVLEMHKIHLINISVKKKEIEKCVVPVECSYTTGGDVAGIGGLPYKDISCEYAAKVCFSNGNDNLFSQFNEPLEEFIANGSLSQKNQLYFRNSAKNLLSIESVTLNMERISSLNLLVEHDQYGVFAMVEGNHTEEVPLVPGVYKVSATLLLDDSVNILPDYRCSRYGVLGYDTEECNLIGGANTSKFLTGTLKFDTPETYVVITPEDLYTSKELTFYVLNYDMKGIPATFVGNAKECGGLLCLPGAGCAFEACGNVDVTMNGLVLEDLSAVNLLKDIGKRPEIRVALEPTFS